MARRVFKNEAGTINTQKEINDVANGTRYFEVYFTALSAKVVKWDDHERITKIIQEELNVLNRK